MSIVERDGYQKRSLEYISDKCVRCGICIDICPTESLGLGPVLPIARGLVDMEYVNIHDKSCVLCGLCATACPFEAMEFKIDSKNIKDLEEYPHWKHTASIDNEECIFCKACEIACPQDAITVKRDFPKRSYLVIGEIEVDQDKCIYCGICEEMCPPEAISITRKTPKDRDINIDEDKCVYCLVCKRICPVDAIKAACGSCSYGEYRIKPEDAEVTGRTILQEEDCVNCGWCQGICPVDAVKVIKPFEGQILQNISECKGDSCHACMDVCPCNAVSIIYNKSSIEAIFCILCGACSQVCPQNCITVKREKMNLDNIRSKSWQKKLSRIIQ